MVRDNSVESNYDKKKKICKLSRSRCRRLAVNSQNDEIMTFIKGYRNI